MKRGSLLFLTLFVILSLILAGCLSVPGLQGRNIQILGIVVNQHNEPIEGLKVIVEPGGLTYTDADGQWSFSQAKKGSKVSPVTEGKILSEIPAVNKEQQFFTITVDLSLQAYSISGVVLDTNGQAVPGVKISFSGDATINTVTNIDGEFRQDNLMGEVTVKAEKDGFLIPDVFTLKEANSDLVFLATAITPEPEPEPEPEFYIITGTILDQSNTPLMDVLVMTKDESGRVKTVLTNEKGQYFQSGLLGKVTVSATKAGWEFTPENRDVTEEDLNVDFFGTSEHIKTYDLAGNVSLANGTELSGVLITFEFLDASSMDNRYTTTDTSGNWKMDGLVGKVKVTPTRAGYLFSPGSQQMDKSSEVVNFVATIE